MSGPIRLTMGAPLNDDDGEDSGSAYAFLRVGDSWIQVSKITAGDGTKKEEFGFSVAVGKDFAAVGANMASHPKAGVRAGAVYVYRAVDDLLLPVEPSLLTVTILG